MSGQTERVDYSRPPTFRNYCCSSCNASGVKLWLLLSATTASDRLRCIKCAAASLGLDANHTNAGQLDAIALCLMSYDFDHAIPADMIDGQVYTFWGALSLPEGSLEWWESLPLL